MKLPTPTPKDLGSAATQRICDFADQEMRELLTEAERHNFSTVEQLAGLMTTASHVSAHMQARAELAAIKCAPMAQVAHIASELVRKNMSEAVAKLVPVTVTMLAEGMAENAGGERG